MNNGFIVLHRKLLEWEWSDDPYTVSLWVHLLLRANHEDKKWRGFTVKRGQMVSTRDELAEVTGLTVRQLRTRLSWLEECGCIERKTTNKYTVITICKYDDYQRITDESDQQTTNKRPAKRPTNDQQEPKRTKRKSSGYEVKHTESDQQNDQQTTTNNNIIYNNISHSNSAYVREKEKLAEAWSSEEWRESVCMNHKLTSELLEEKWQEFKLHCKANDDAHDDIADIRKHFNSWLYQKQYGSNKSNNRKQLSSREERDRETAELVAEFLGNCS